MRSALRFLCVVALGTGVAHANDKPRNPGFDGYDKNNDGVISRAETVGHPRLAKRFDAIDTDNNGRISRKEWLASRAKPKTSAAKKPSSQDARFSSLDRNKDGVLNKSEARGHLGSGSASSGR